MRTRTSAILGLLLLCSGIAWFYWPEFHQSAPVSASPSSGSDHSGSVSAPRDFGADRQSPLTTFAADVPKSTPQAAGESATNDTAENERYPDAPGTPGHLPFASGSLEERAWILRRALRDLQDLGETNAAVEKAGNEILPTALGAILDLQGRGIEVQIGTTRFPRIGDDEYLFQSQTKYFVIKRFEFPEYETYRNYIDPDGPHGQFQGTPDWLALVERRARDAISLVDSVTKK